MFDFEQEYFFNVNGTILESWYGRPFYRYNW